MSEYSMEEVRARLGFTISDHNPRILTWASGGCQPASMAECALWDAYAERIKADESVVAVAWCSLTPNGQIAYFDGRPMIMTGRVGNEHHPVPLFTRPPAQAEQVEDDAEARSHARMIHDFPRLSAFFQKHALGSKLPVSCFACGHVGERTITHAELADVYICKTCAERIAKASAQSADPLAHPTTNSPETDSKLVGGPVAQGEAVQQEEYGGPDFEERCETLAKIERDMRIYLDEGMLLTPYTLELLCNRIKSVRDAGHDNVVMSLYNFRTLRRLAAQRRAVPDGDDALCKLAEKYGGEVAHDIDP